MDGLETEKNNWTNNWVDGWLQRNDARKVSQAVHGAGRDCAISSIYITRRGGMVLRYTADDIDDLFIPAGGRSNKIDRAEMDLDSYVGPGRGDKARMTRVINARADGAARRALWLADSLDAEFATLVPGSAVQETATQVLQVLRSTAGLLRSIRDNARAIIDAD